jgi:glycogen synthase
VTDDFCPDPLATRVPADAGALEAEPGFPPRRFLQTRIDDLVEAMDRVCQAGAVRPEGWRTAREAVLNDFSWDRAAAMLLDCAGLCDVQPAAAIP